ncbi:hypothetical protein [Ottowia caeni]|uniref:hypothetical protein n=1 Tax=Ottowia caeni TaxID=2870339 RepID=UPI003D759AC0
MPNIGREMGGAVLLGFAALSANLRIRYFTSRQDERAKLCCSKMHPSVTYLTTRVKEDNA